MLGERPWHAHSMVTCWNIIRDGCEPCESGVFQQLSVLLISLMQASSTKGVACERQKSKNSAIWLYINSIIASIFQNFLGRGGHAYAHTTNLTTSNLMAMARYGTGDTSIMMWACDNHVTIMWQLCVAVNHMSQVSWNSRSCTNQRSVHVSRLVSHVTITRQYVVLPTSMVTTVGSAPCCRSTLMTSLWSWEAAAMSGVQPCCGKVGRRGVVREKRGKWAERA